MTETQRDEMLISISNAVKKHDEMLVDLLKEVHNIKEEQVSQREDMTKMGKTLALELVRQRKNMAKMEYNLGDKIDALFDVKEIYEEKFIENDENIKSIRNNLDLHDIRLVALESKAN